jgi:hypothetical protein
MLSYTRHSNTRHRDQFLWSEHFATRCLYTYNHTQYTEWYISEFYPRRRQNLVVNSTYIFDFMTAIIYFNILFLTLYM